MVFLRKMRNDEYTPYCDYFIADYSREIVQNYGETMREAIKLAEKTLVDSFPDGPQNSKHELLCIEAEIEGELKLTGYLWHSLNSSDKSTFIYDFFISPCFRGQGYGRKSIRALELLLKPLAVEQIKLRVAYQNQRALKLYQEVGFVITGYNMSKKIQ